MPAAAGAVGNRTDVLILRHNILRRDHKGFAADSLIGAMRDNGARPLSSDQTQVSLSLPTCTSVYVPGMNFRPMGAKPNVYADPG